MVLRKKKADDILMEKSPKTTIEAFIIRDWALAGVVKNGLKSDQHKILFEH